MFIGVPEKLGERDVASNPYVEESKCTAAFTGKVYLEQKSHQYYLRDDEGVYPDYILSGSSVVKYARALLSSPGEAMEFFPKADLTVLVVGSKPSREAKEPSVNMKSRARFLQLGTLFHWYAEQRILGRPTPRPSLIPEEARQFDAFFDLLPPGFFSHCEVSVGSFLHKVCGTIDAIHFNGAEEFIWDWKNHKSVFEPGKMVLDSTRFVSSLGGRSVFSTRYFYVANQEISPGVVLPKVYHCVYDKLDEGVFDYMIQQATYRKARMLEGRKVSTTAYLGIVTQSFHPDQKELHPLALELARPLPQYGGRSCVEIVQWVYDTREYLLSMLLKKK